MKTVFAVLISLLWATNAYATVNFKTSDVVPLGRCQEAGEYGIKINVINKDDRHRVFWMYRNSIYALGTFKTDTSFFVNCTKFTQ